MKRNCTRLPAFLLAMLLTLLTAASTFAVADEPLPIRSGTPFGTVDPGVTRPQEPVNEPPTQEEPTTQEPVNEPPTQEEPTTQEPVTEPPTQHTHAFSAWKTVRRATMKQNGRMQRECACGAKQVKSIARIASVKIKYKTRVYSGKALTNPVSVKDTAGIALKKGRDYKVKYKNNRNIGKAYVVLTGKRNYKFSVKRSYQIIPQSTSIKKVLPSATKATVQWKAAGGQCGGYQLQVSTSQNFQSNVIVRRITNPKTTSVVVNNLKQKTTYYARIRSFLKVKDVSYYANWSKTVSFKTGSASGHAIDGQVPKSKAVSPSWFDDAVFVGDSVSLGLNYYEAATDALGKAQFLTAGSLGSGNALQSVSDNSVHPRYNGQKMKVEKAVAACGAKKVYLMLGMNDIGAYGVDKSVQNFRTLCKNILTESPFVTIYVESVTPRVNQSAKSDNVKLNNTNITSYNKKLAAVCAEEGWYFVNVAEAMFDSTGHLKRAYCSDPDGMGMHFSSEGCRAWVNYLYTHTA